MDKQYFENKSDIFYSCLYDKLYVGEHFLPEHTLMRVYSGTMEIRQVNDCKILGAGETYLFARNQLAQISKLPKNGTPFKSITILLPQKQLLDYFSTSAIHPQEKLTSLSIKSHPLIDSLFQSMLPYYEMEEDIPAELTGMKIKEAIAILQQIEPQSLHILTDFTEPGKIDLENFMLENYQFNVPAERFAYLTGRSLATFKRDFKKIFFESPSKWLQHKRLVAAYELMKENKQKASEVYMQVGFENLSHFSYAFKNQFGFPPSAIFNS